MTKISKLDLILNRLDKIDSRLDKIEKDVSILKQDVTLIQQCPTIKQELIGKSLIYSSKLPYIIRFKNLLFIQKN